MLDEIEAKYHLAVDELDVAADLAKRALDYHRNSFTLGLMAKVESALARSAAGKGMTVMAESHKKRALQLVNEGLKQDPSNPALLNQLRSLTS